jgi:hypothetical protein
MSHQLRPLLIAYQYLAGLCDAVTGILLIAAPAFTLGLMGLTILPQPAAFVRYIGVFVFSVGLTYLWIALRYPLEQRSALAWSVQWTITALIRLLVAFFVFWQVTSGALEPRWMIVAISDGLFAAIQITGLQRGWIERAA